MTLLFPQGGLKSSMAKLGLPLGRGMNYRRTSGRRDTALRFPLPEIGFLPK